MGLITTLLATAIFTITLLILRILYLLLEIHKTRTQPTEPQFHRIEPCKTLVVLGSGGHTSEMLHMVKQLDPNHYNPMEFVVADTDHTSVQRLQALLPRDPPHKIHVIPRSREVGQSFRSSFATTLYALIHAIAITIQTRPELLLCNGPGTCVPVVIGAWMLRIVRVPCRFVFVESFCRAQTLSLTGKLLYHVVDTFVVHWESLHRKYPKSYLSSTFVKRSPQGKIKGEK